MAILRSISGEFYEVPDKQLDKFLVPDDQVKAKLDEANLPLPGGPAEGSAPGAYSGFAPVVVQFLTPPQAMGYCGPPPPAPQEAVAPYGIHVDWGGHGGGHWGGGHGGGHWGGGHGGGHWGGGHHGGHWGGHWGGHPGWGHGGGHWGGGHCW